MNFEELKELLKTISSDDLDKLKEYLGAIDSEEETSEDKQTEDSEGGTTAQETESERSAEEGNATEGESSVEQSTEGQDNETQPQSSIKEDLPQALMMEDNIPQMQKGSQSDVEENVEETQRIVDEVGNELPIDYEQIIEAQNAKIAALQAENSSLKNKVEGAFGYSAKPAVPAKINRLYDDATDVHFHK